MGSLRPARPSCARDAMVRLGLLGSFSGLPSSARCSTVPKTGPGLGLGRRPKPGERAPSSNLWCLRMPSTRARTAREAGFPGGRGVGHGREGPDGLRQCCWYLPRLDDPEFHHLAELERLCSGKKKSKKLKITVDSREKKSANINPVVASVAHLVERHLAKVEVAVRASSLAQKKPHQKVWLFLDASKIKMLGRSEFALAPRFRLGRKRLCGARRRRNRGPVGFVC